jgi:hypothetical protein
MALYRDLFVSLRLASIGWCALLHDIEEHCIWRAPAHECGQRRRGSAGALQIQCSSLATAMQGVVRTVEICSNSVGSTRIFSRTSASGAAGAMEINTTMAYPDVLNVAVEASTLGASGCGKPSQTRR